MTAEAVVEAAGFSYRYGGATGVLAVDGIDLRVERGELVALLGTNGAGKTTTLEVLEGHRAPTTGRVRVLGGVPGDRRGVRPRMGMMLQEAGAAGDLTVEETLALAGAISAREDEVGRVLAAIDLAGKARVRVAQLSGGERRRLDFGCAIWGTPELLFLDEPTTGLDPAARDRLWAAVDELRGRGVTIILTTHYLEEAQQRADRICIMHRGAIVRSGTLAELVAELPSRIEFVLPDGAVPPLPITGARGGRCTIETDDLQRDLTSLLSWAEREGVRLERLRATSSSLDDLFRGLAD